MLVKSSVVVEDDVDMMVIKEGGNDRASGDQQVSSIKREQMLIKGGDTDGDTDDTDKHRYIDTDRPTLEVHRGARAHNLLRQTQR